MQKITSITSAAKQKQTILLADGTFFTIQIEYRPNQYSWWISSLVYGDLEIKSLKITTNLDILFQFRNQIPFGLACFTKDNQEPQFQEDFESGRCELFVLSEENVDELVEVYRT